MFDIQTEWVEVLLLKKKKIARDVFHIALVFVKALLSDPFHSNIHYKLNIKYRDNTLSLVWNIFYTSARVHADM